MAVRRQANFIGQLRVDVSDLRGVESAVAADFDVLAGKIMAGRAPLVVRGFTVATANSGGNPADQLALTVASGLLLHFGASEAGTLFVVDDGHASESLAATNPKVSGSFSASAANYVGLDFTRSADSTTADLKQVLDANSVQEVPKTIPTARTLQYSILITTTPFSASSNICPIAKVVTDANNAVVSVTDARPMMFRLGTGSDNPNASGFFAWTSRTENPITYNPSGSTADPFSGGDKGLISLKNWMDAVMTRLWEVGSGQFWYSATARDNVKIIHGQPVIVATGDNYQWDAVTGGGTLTWKSLSVSFENSTVYYNTISDRSAILNADGQCLYIDVQRGSTLNPLVPAVGTLTALPTPLIPGSRFILAWRVGGNIFTRDRPYEVGRTLPVATSSTYGAVKLSSANTPAISAIVPALDVNGAIAIAASGGNANAITSTGNGSGTGITATGGNSGIGGSFTPGAGQPVGVQSAGYVHLTGANLPLTGGVSGYPVDPGNTNLLTPNNIVKAWGKIRVGNNTGATLIAGYNLTGSSANGNGAKLFYCQSMADSDYVVVATAHVDDGGPLFFVTATSTSGGTMTLWVWNSSGTIVNLWSAGALYTISFVVLARQ